jgi:hypothetical protein
MEGIWEEHEIELGNQAFIGLIIIYWLVKESGF